MPLLARHFWPITAILLLSIAGLSLTIGPAYPVLSLHLAPIILAMWAPRLDAAYLVAAIATTLLAANTARVATALDGSAIFIRLQFVLIYWLTAVVIVRYRKREDDRRREVDVGEAAAQALRQSVKNLEDLKYALDQSAIVATTNVQGDITSVNHKFCEISKYSREELLGQNHRILNSGLHPTEFFRDMYQTIANGRVWRGEIRNRAKDGSLYWVDTTIVPLLNDQRKPSQYIAIRYDITERKRSEAALRDQTALAQLGKMAAVVAHEVRNPLAGIRGALQVISRRLPESSQERGVLTEVVGRIDGLNEIVQDLLLFARPAKPILAPVPVAQVLRETLGLFREDTLAEGVAVDLPETTAVAMTDAQQLKLVLLNLLMNGAQAMQSRGRLRIEVTSTAAHCTIRIVDEGPGIPPEVREHLFEPFFTTRHRGTGLGLVTARRLIEAQGGTLTLECPADGGTVAIITLGTGRTASAS
jgi:PAS domain S-box-containing protein